MRREGWCRGDVRYDTMVLSLDCLSKELLFVSAERGVVVVVLQTASCTVTSAYPTELVERRRENSMAG